MLHAAQLYILWHSYGKLLIGKYQCKSSTSNVWPFASICHIISYVKLPEGFLPGKELPASSRPRKSRGSRSRSPRSSRSPETETFDVEVKLLSGETPEAQMRSNMFPKLERMFTGKKYGNNMGK